MVLYHDNLKTAGETPIRLKLTSSGAVLIDVLSEEAATRLPATTYAGRVQIEAQLPAAYRVNVASIRGIPTTCTNPLGLPQ